MQIADSWLRDIPQQFLHKPKIEVLIRAFARQLQEVEQAFFDVTGKTDLNTAFGRNLDLIVGEIVSLSRKDAVAMDVISGGAAMTDERYRKFLRYKVLQNTSECTYWDLIEGISMMWDLKRVEYREEIEYPATIIFHGEFDMDEPDAVEFYPELCIRASGVGVILEKAYYDEVLVPIEVDAALRLYMEFFPYMNIAPLLLDGTWKLDGKTRLSKYKSDIPVELYPVGIRMQIEAETGVSYQEEAKYYGNIMAEPGYKAEVGFQMVAGEDVDHKMAVKMMAAAYVSADADAKLYNIRKLDGTWKLDGTRPLNGGQYEL